MSVSALFVRAHLVEGIGSQAARDDARDPTPEEVDEAVVAIKTSTVVTTRILQQFLDIAAKTTRRFLARFPQPLAELSVRLYFGDPPKWSKVGAPFEGRLFSPAAGPALSVDGIAAINASISAGEGPDLKWQLYARSFRLFVLDEDFRQAILESAIAVEVALDEAYRLKAEANGTWPVVKLLLEKMRGLRDQLTDGAKVVLGASFSEVDNTSHTRVLALAERRNDIVHNGADPDVTETELREMLAAVRALIEWLEGL